jgi:DNA-binding transcriptional ArsR family regulator
MVQYQMLDRAFAALSDRTRREILTRLSHGPASISALAEPFAMSLTGLKKHIQVLEEAKLVSTEKVGRSRVCRLGPDHLDAVADWVEVFRSRWERKLDGLEAYLAEKKKGQRQ